MASVFLGISWNFLSTSNYLLLLYKRLTIPPHLYPVISRRLAPRVDTAWYSFRRWGGLYRRSISIKERHIIMERHYLQIRYLPNPNRVHSLRFTLHRRHPALLAVPAHPNHPRDWQPGQFRLSLSELHLNPLPNQLLSHWHDHRRGGEFLLHPSPKPFGHILLERFLYHGHRAVPPLGVYHCGI